LAVESLRPQAGFASHLAIALWLGAALFLAAVVAPAAFAVLPSRTLAGQFIGRILSALFVAGLLTGLASLVLSAIEKGGRRRIIRSVGSALMAFACAMAQFSVAPRISRLRESAGAALDSLARDNPVRAEFAHLHMMSVAWLAVAMLAATATIFFAWPVAETSREDTTPPATTTKSQGEEDDVGGNQN
jgi:hypothetical protein